MKNEVGDKSPNEAALSVLIEGEALTLVPLRSICRGGYHPPERRQIRLQFIMHKWARVARKEERKKKKEKWWWRSDASHCNSTFYINNVISTEVERSLNRVWRSPSKN